MCFITRCCTQWYRTKRSREIVGGFIQKNSIVASASFPIIGEPAAGKTKICRDSCADPNPPELSCSHQLGTAGVLLCFRYLRPVRPFRRPRRRRYVLFD